MLKKTTLGNISSILLDKLRFSLNAMIDFFSTCLSIVIQIWNLIIVNFKKFLNWAYDHYDLLYLSLVCLWLLLTSNKAINESQNLNIYLVSSIFIFIAFRKNQKENHELSELLKTQRDFFDASKTLTENIKGYQKRLNLIESQITENSEKLNNSQSSLELITPLLKDVLNKQIQNQDHIHILQKEWNSEKEEFKNFHIVEKKKHLKFLTNFVDLYDIIMKASKEDSNAIHENLKKSLEHLKEQTQISQKIIDQNMRYNTEDSIFKDYLIHWEATKDTSLVDTIKNISKHPFHYEGITLKKGEITVYCQDKNTDQSNADQSNADQSNTDQSNTDQSNTDQSNTDQSNADQPKN
jgi:hypothetical protein